MIGKILGKRYEIIEKIGTGGMSVVYKARCRLLNRFVAVKILKQEFADNDEFIKRFKIEAQSAASLSHPNIVSIYDVGNDDDLNYIVMEYVEGHTLKEYISENKISSWKEAANIASQIASALEDAHKNGIVHRDIKPHNIIITTEGVAKVTDFGIARAATFFTVTFAGNAIGSVHYFSPEQARGGYTDHKSDIYSLGVVLYEMLTGKLPFDGDTPVTIALKHVQETPIAPIEINKYIPQGLNDAVLKAMAKSTDKRYPSANAFMNDLKDIINHPEVSIPKNEERLSKVDSPTLVIPAVNKYTNSNDIQEDKMKETNNKLKPKTKKSTLYAAIGTALVIVSIMSFFVYKMLFAYSPDDLQTQIPNLIGKTEDEARALLANSHLTLKVTQRKESENVEPGLILEQSPSVGMNVRIPSDIEVILSSGTSKIDVPDVENSDYRKAKIDIEKSGLATKVTYEFSETIPIGFVVKTIPSAGSSITKGEAVEIIVSKGPETAKIPMPNLIGKTDKEAKQVIQDSKLILGNISYTESSKTFGTVIKQSVIENSEVEEGTSIDLVLSSGSSSNSNSDKQQIQLDIVLPKNKSSIDVEVILITSKGTRKVVLPETTVKTSQSPLSIKLDGEGKGRVQVYFDGVLNSEEFVNFEEAR